MEGKNHYKNDKEIEENERVRGVDEEKGDGLARLT